MIPILYEENETKFLMNGIGKLSDAISCQVTEERNGIYELYLKYPITGSFYKELRNARLIYAVPSDGAKAQPFRIYKVGKAIDGMVEVYAEHISYQMTHIPIAPFSANDVRAALANLKGAAVVACPFEFWTDKSSKGSFIVDAPCSVRSKLGGSDGSIIDVFGGEWEFDRYNVKLHSSRGSDNGVVIRYGKNLVDLKQEENIQNTITGIYPYYKDSDGTFISLPEKTISCDNAGKFPYPRIVPVDFSGEFDAIPTVNQLRTAANRYIDSHDMGIPSVSITVSFQPLWKTEEYKNIAPLEHVKLCDTVSVEFEKLGISVKARVNKTIYNVLLDRYDSIDIGDVKSNLASTIIEQKKEIERSPSVSFLEQAILDATAQITGNRGGYIVFRNDGNGKPYEMLIMDTDDIETAKNVWRFNQAGIGHSSNGYNGPYATAITQDGKIVADFITVGSLMANLIKAGVLSDVTGNNYWNMETGEFVAKNITISGGKIKMETNEKMGTIELTSGRNMLTLGAGGLSLYCNIADGNTGTYYTFSEDGFEAGVAQYGFGWAINPPLLFMKKCDDGRYRMGSSNCPSFTFKSADGQNITVKNGIITEH